ncbi:MAG: ADP-ribosylglycohydrolase family protein [Armatimonadota bacterium]
MERSVIGCILGTAVGDAIGLPVEGLSRKRQKRVFPKLDGYRFFFGRGMISDDTEHTCMVAQSIIESVGDCDAFTKCFASRLKRWLIMLPAGAGMATVKSALRLLIGTSPSRSGVFSAGNGPAMRSAIIGVCYGDDLKKMRDLVRASTRITHTDPKAEYGAFAVALAAYLSAQGEANPRDYLHMLVGLLGDESEEFINLVTAAVESSELGATTEEFATGMGLERGVSGYVYSTVPVALYAWFRNLNDYRAAVLDVIHCGGDTDTTAAIVGGIIGAGVGKDGIPVDWLSGIVEWPRSVLWMENLGTRLVKALSNNEKQSAPKLSALGLLARNVFFLVIVLLHGFRRLLWF